MNVPFVDLHAQAREMHDEFAATFASVTGRAAYTMGPELKEFEAAFAAFCGVEHCVGVSSGTDAVKLALLAAGVGPGDEVAVPANTFIATAEAVSHIGAVPVFVDVDPETALLDPEALAEVCDEREGMLSAVIPVHLYGQPCDMDAIQAIADENGLIVVEDACQAHGARYKGRPCGSMGVTAAFSFYPGQNLGALGDGGAVVANDEQIADHLRLLRNHGRQDKYTHAVVGYCDRLHNLQAAFLAAKLKQLPSWNVQRRAAARIYDQGCLGIAGVTPITTREDVQHVYHLYVVRLPEVEAADALDPIRLDDPQGQPISSELRDDIRDALSSAGVESGIHYPVPLHLQPAYALLGHTAGDFPVAESLAGRILSLPIFPGITPAQQEHVLATLAESLVVHA
jgi:dTDP-4-amino-4,6-dideoxygalactose transaminase